MFLFCSAAYAQDIRDTEPEFDDLFPELPEEVDPNNQQNGDLNSNQQNSNNNNNFVSCRINFIFRLPGQFALFDFAGGREIASIHYFQKQPFFSGTAL